MYMCIYIYVCMYTHTAFRYTTFRRDSTDGWGGVLLIVKSKFICEQISISEGPELVAIKIQPHKHPLIVAACYCIIHQNVLKNRVKSCSKK